MPDLNPRCVHLYYAFIEQVRALPSHALEVLSASEKIQYEKFFFEKDKDSYFLARYILRTNLTKYFPKIEPQAWKFKFNSFGKPLLSEEHLVDQLHFNLAHSGGMVVAAFAIGHEIGVDVEKTSRSVRFLEVAKKSFTEAEYQNLKTLSVGETQRLKFFELWTLKEAYVKARGQGLQIPLDQFSFQTTENDKIEIKFEIKATDSSQNCSEQWQIRKFHPAPEYQVAVVLNSIEEVRIQEIFWQPLV
jgi:4'-phosphopantetheinyl transferase